MIVTILSFLTLVAVGVQAAFEDYNVPFQLLYRILETLVLCTILALFKDKRG